MFRTHHTMTRRVRLWLVAAMALVIGGSGLRAEPPKPAPLPKPAPVTVPKPTGTKAEPPKAPPRLPSPPQPPTPRPDPTDLRSPRLADMRPAQRVTPLDQFAPDQGRFRVQLLGFRCDHQTRDDILENDGAGDEVIVRCWTRVLDGETVVTNRANGVDGIFAADDHHGDAWQRFLRAGSANLDHGGIATGDRVPGLPDRPTDPGAAGRLPLTVFEGTLVAGRTVAVVVPTLWEWDDFCGDTPGLLLRGSTFPARFWTNTPFVHENDRLGQFESAMTSLTRTDRFSRLARSYATAAADTPAVRRGVDLNLPTVSGDMGGNRGIGSTDSGDGVTFQPRGLVLNYAIADRLDREGRAIPVRYLDSEGLDGDYTVFLFVRRLP